MARASAAILRVRAGGINVHRKPDASPVTEADEAAEAIILEELSRFLPGIAVISEEAASRSGIAQPPETFALVDPLDGTREFIAGREEFTVNIAIVRAGRPLLGVVGAPALGLIWRAEAPRGAERLRLAGDEIGEPVPIRVAAHRGGIKTFILPRRNAKDLAELPAVVRDGMELIQEILELEKDITKGLEKLLAEIKPAEAKKA